MPTTGTLKFGTSNVTAGQVITAANIPNLTFVPNTDATTQGSFTFKVTDSLGGTTSAAAATMTINVTPDAGPLAVDSTATAIENHTYTFKVSDFGYSDDSGTDPLGSVTIASVPGNGTLYNGTTALTAGGAMVASIRDRRSSCSSSGVSHRM